MVIEKILTVFVCFCALSIGAQGASFHEEFHCVSGFGETCDCGPPCLTQYSNGTCVPKKCYAYNHDLAACQESGPHFVPAIVLQSIPFTGAFGSGFGNMGRWDLFQVAMGIVFGPVAVLCLGFCWVLVCERGGEGRDGNSCWECCSYCFTLLWSIAIIAYWVWGIVVIANKEVLGPNGCQLQDSSQMTGAWVNPTPV